MAQQISNLVSLAPTEGGDTCLALGSGDEKQILQSGGYQLSAWSLFCCGRLQSLWQ